MTCGQDIKKWQSQTEHLLSKVESPSTAKLLEVLCFEPLVNKQLHQKIIRDLSRMMADEMFNDDILAEYEDDYEDHTDCLGDILDCGDRD